VIQYYELRRTGAKLSTFRLAFLSTLVVLDRGNTTPLVTEIFLVITAGSEDATGIPWGDDRDDLTTLKCAEHSPETKNYLVPDVNTDSVEKP
jgi:hypothetical protein